VKIIFKNILLNTIVFLYVYDISFAIFPSILSTKAIIAILGFGIFFVKLFQNGVKLKVNIILFKIGIVTALLMFFSMLSILYNMTSDFEFLIYAYKVIGTIFAAYFIIQVMKKIKLNSSFFNISSLIVNVVLIQAFIASIMYLSPDAKYFLYSIQNIKVDFMLAFTSRFMGFGSHFFGAGIVNGMALILLAILLRHSTFKSREALLLSLKFFIIFIIGMALSRTTIVGFAIACIIIFLPKNLSFTISKNKLPFISILVFLPIILGLILKSNPVAFELISPALNFAFEMFVNLYESASFSTRSSDVMLQMYIFPDEIKTWIIGDGLYKNPFEEEYYMHTDIGYLRLIYYFGILGLLVYFTLQYYLLVPALKIFKLNYSYIVFIFIYLLILNLKGVAQLTTISALYLMAALELKKYHIGSAK
jgi:hypothetical protein